MSIQRVLLCLVLLISCSLAQDCEPQFSNVFYIKSTALIDIVDSNNKFIQKAVITPRSIYWSYPIPDVEYIWYKVADDFKGRTE